MANAAEECKLLKFNLPDLVTDCFKELITECIEFPEFGVDGTSKSEAPSVFLIITT